MKAIQILNPKHEILNKFKILNSNVLNFVWNLGHWKLDIVSNFPPEADQPPAEDIKISDLSER